jgi:putative methionine-R-sulfoxide reductase with GAF domain
MLVTLRQIVQEVSTAKHLDDALDIIVHRVKAALPLDACAVYLTDVESNQYVLMATNGFNPSSIGEVRIDQQESLPGPVGEICELITVPDAATHPRYHPSSATREDRYQSILGVPLIHYHQVLGVLVAWKHAPGPFCKDELTFFITIAAQLAKAIHDASDVDEVSRMLGGDMQGSAFSQGIQMAAARSSALPHCSILWPGWNRYRIVRPGTSLPRIPSSGLRLPPYMRSCARAARAWLMICQSRCVRYSMSISCCRGTTGWCQTPLRAYARAAGLRGHGVTPLPSM